MGDEVEHRLGDLVAPRRARRRPGRCATLRSSTSAQIISVMPSTSAQATRANASRSLPYAASSPVHALLRQHLPELLAVLRARLDGVRPADLLRLLDVGLARRRVEADHLDAGLRLRAWPLPGCRTSRSRSAPRRRGPFGRDTRAALAVSDLYLSRLMISATSAL